MSKVSPSTVLRSTDMSRFRFDAATLTLGSNDPIGTYGGVSTQLGGVGMSQVSDFIFSCSIDTDVLVLEFYRFDLVLIASTAGSNDLQATLRVVLEWLRESDALWVSRSDFLRLADIYRCKFDSSTSTSPMLTHFHR